MKTQQFMYHTLIALLPGAMVMAYFFGPGIVINLAACIATGWLCETLVYRLNKTANGHPSDGSGLLTCALIGLALPPFLPIPIAMAGVVLLWSSANMFMGD